MALLLPMNEQNLIEKLITESHLSVPERHALPNGVARFSVIVAQASLVLERDGWLPPGRKGISEFSGALIERLDGGYAVHKCHEIGVMRFSEIETQRYSQLKAAVRAWLRIEHGESIDGIAIAWDE